MDDSSIFRLAIRGGYVAAICFTLSLFNLTAPYGRHYAGSPLLSSWLGRVSRLLPPRLAWFIMECPALFLPPPVFLAGRYATEPLPRFLLSLFLLHYGHRVLIFPLRIRPSARHMPLSVVLSALLFNVYNGYIQARSLTEYASPHVSAPLPARIRLPVGAAVFMVGMWINIWADSVLISLRTKADAKDEDNSSKDKSNGSFINKDDDGNENKIKQYRIPRGGLYEYVSCPNYLGEIIEWTAWAFMTWSSAGLVFLLLTLANLVPRALAHHRWYAAHFAHYPASRRALIPFLL